MIKTKFIFNQMNVLPSLLPELLREIMYNAQFKDIRAFCFASKHNKICDNLFWIFIFNRDELPIITQPNNLYDWLKEYDKVCRSYVESKIIMTKFEHSAGNVIEILTPIGIFPKRFDKKIGDIYGKDILVSTLFIFKYSNMYQIKRLAFNDCGPTVCLGNLKTKQFCAKLLCHIIYYCQDVRICDKEYKSLRI
jgi:hypothetical protein